MPDIRQFIQELLRTVKTFGQRKPPRISHGFFVNADLKLFAIIPFTILTRVLGPEEYGKLSIALAVAAFAGELTDMGANATFVRFGSESAHQGDLSAFKKLVSITLRWKLVWGTAVCILGIFLSNWLAEEVFHDDLLNIYIILAFVQGFSVIFTTLEFVILQSLQSFKKLGWFNIINGLLNLFLIAGVWIFIGLSSLTAFLAYFFAVFLLALLTLKLIPGGYINISSWDREIYKKFKLFFKWMFIASLGAIIFNQVNVIMLGIFSTQIEVGYYNAAFRIVVLTQLLTGSYDNVITAKFSSRGSVQFTRGYLKQAFVYAGVIILILLGIGIFADFAVLILAGDKFINSVQILHILLIWTGISTLGIPFYRVLFSLNQTKIIALITLLASIILVGLNFCSNSSSWGYRSRLFAPHITSCDIDNSWIKYQTFLYCSHN